MARKTSGRSLGVQVETRDPNIQNIYSSSSLYQNAQSLVTIVLTSLHSLHIHILICNTLLSIYFYEFTSRRNDTITHLCLCLFL
jgi:hypothetical protein